MLHTLQNELFTATFKEQGAELCSLRSQKNGLEYIWEGNSDIWGRHAPILFPIVGRLKDNSYRLDGKEYSLPQHGFARDKRWQTAKEGEDRLLFRLTSDADTLALYPFAFELLLEYHLEANKLTTTYRVKNSSAASMPFSIGGHPAFRCPLLPGESFSEYYLEFEKAESLERQLLRHGLRTGKKVPVLNDELHLPLSPALFDDDALVFEGPVSDYILIRNKRNSHQIRVDIDGAPYLGIWTKAGGAPFICIEPWWGIGDTEAATRQDFRQKEGIRELEPGHQFECSYAITID
jgi:galactose mutarotase-like enzyme